MMILSALLMLGSCSDDDNSGNEGPAYARISLSAEKLQAPKEGGQVSVTVTSDADWRLAGVCDWAHPSITEGKSGDAVTFTIDENTTGGDQSTTFKFFTGASVAPLVIESVQGYSLGLLSDDAMEVTRDGGRVTITLSSNISDLSVDFGDGGEEWLSFESQNTFADKQIVALNVAANENYVPRSATVTVSSPLVEESVTVTIDQARTDFFEVTQDEMEDNMLLLDKSAQTVQLTVLTNMDFTAEVTEGGDWLTVTQQPDGVAGDDGRTTYVLNCVLGATEDARAGVIKFKVTGASTVNVSIVQKDENEKVARISDSFAGELVELGWITPVGDYYLVLEKGLQATVFDMTHDSWIQIEDLEGIENFPNLETLKFSCYYYMKTLDISGLHKVKTLSFTNAIYVSLFNFGDNPITSFELLPALSNGASSADDLTFISEKLEYLNCNQRVNWWAYTQSIDVSGCPALKTLVANDLGNALKTIYIKKGQEIDIQTTDGVEIVEK